MTISTLPALILLAAACGVFLRFGTMRDKTSPARGHGAGSQGETRRARPSRRPGARRPEVES